MRDLENNNIMIADPALISAGRLVEGAYAQNEELTGIVIPEGTEDIGEVAFFGCINLHSVSFPDTLRFIREEAFGESGLESVTIPAGVEEIAEKAFFSCSGLKRIEVAGQDTIVGPDAFGDCRNLFEGYVACGYPKSCNPPEELLYTLLWCTCPERHTEEVCRRAEAYIRENEALIMERILKFNNTAAMNGISKRKLLRQENINGYVAAANENRQAELVALLLAAIDNNTDTSGEFEL